MIEIKKFVEPDLVVIKKLESYNTKYEKITLLFSECLVVVENCDEQGDVDSYNHRHKKYYGCRIVSERIELCIPTAGWIPAYEEIQEKYKDELADKAILGDKACNS